MSIWKRFNRGSFLLALIVTGGGYAVWNWFHPAKYQAHARLQVAAQVPRVLFRTIDTEIENNYKRYQNTQQTLVTSQLALNAAIQDKEVSTYRMIREQVDPIAWLQANLKVEFIAESEVMEISLSGENPQELAGIVNAIKKAYIDEVVNVDIKMRVQRHDKLNKLKERYEELLKQRRETLRKCSETVASDDRLRVTCLKRPELVRLHHDLWTQRIDVHLERADAEARLAQHEKALGPATDTVRKEIDRIEDLLAGLIAQEKFIDDRLEQMAGEIRKAADRELEREQLKTETAVMEDVYRKVAAELEALTVELGSPPRIRTIEDAVAPRLRGEVTNASL